MSETLTQTEAAAKVTTWLAAFESALATGDPSAVVELFGEDSYWRDLVAFTWNIITVEGRDGVRDMLAAIPPDRRSVFIV